jgi:hypothetical protein
VVTSFGLGVLLSGVSPFTVLRAEVLGDGLSIISR